MNRGSERRYCGSCPIRVVANKYLANGRSVIDTMEWEAFVEVEPLNGIQKVMKLSEYHTSL